jgi:hypothetical protein
MTREPVNKVLTVEERMQIFLTLVEAQDGGMTVPRSRTAVAEQYSLSEQQVRRIEQEGLDGQWPPL